MEQEKRNFLLKAVIGVVITVASFLATKSTPSNMGLFTFSYVMVMMLTCPWGWSLPNRLAEKGNTKFYFSLPVYVAIKVMSAVFLGWLAFLFDLYKIFIKK